MKPFKPRHKFGAVQTIRDGIKFPSKRQARYYDELKLKVKAGIVSFFWMEVPVHLPGNVKYRADFVEFHMDGTVHVVDTKGKKTAMYITKKKIVEALYPFKIEEK